MTTRVFVDRAPQSVPAEVVLSAPESHYLVRVRREGTGKPVEVLDGQGNAWTATVVVADPGQVRLRVEQQVPPSPAPVPLHLLLGMPEPPATLDAIAAACALGIRSVTLLHSERAFHEPPGNARIARVQRATLRQCGRRQPVEVHVARFEAALPAAPGRRFLASRDGYPLKTPAIESDEAASLVVGPEGGFTGDELEFAHCAGFAPLWLGPWILETPLAAIAGLSRLRRG